MTRPEYLFSCEGGTILATREHLDKPLITSLSSTHGALTLRDCFGMVAQFVDECESSFMEALSTTCNIHSQSLDRAGKITITSEKLGAFYHIFSVRIHLDGFETRFAVSLAFSARGRTCLERDFEMVARLREQAGDDLFPRPFFIHSMPHRETGTNFVLALSQWLDGYYEWHLSRDPRNGRLKIIVWDTDRQYFFLPKEAENALFRQMSRTLTLCHNPFTGDQVRLWHHAAGDFIVRYTKHSIETRLTTVREYGPLFDITEDGRTPELNSLCFLLDMAARMRLDRIDGTGEPVWLHKKVLPQVFAGFRQGCAVMARRGRIPSDTADRVITLVKEFSHNELLAVYEALAPALMSCSNGDQAIISSNLPRHVDELKAAAI